MINITWTIFHLFLLFGISICSELSGGFEAAAARHLLATTEEKSEGNATVYFHNCSLLYSRGIEIRHVASGKATTIYTLPGDNSTFSLDGSTCGTWGDKKNGYSVLSVNYKTLTGAITQFSMNLTFNTTLRGQWFLQEMAVTMKCGASKEKTCTDMNNVKMTADFMRAPVGFSYHCYQPPMISDKGNSSMGIYFNKLQVQPLGVKGGKFSRADDCVGFFSAGVWSSLFITLILALILIYGIGMISSINVMDRFDDPKGPGIQVNVNE